MRRTGVSKTCEFPRRNAVFLQKWPSRAGKEGGAPGVGGRGGMWAGEGQKRQKLGKNAQFWGFDL